MLEELHADIGNLTSLTGLQLSILGAFSELPESLSALTALELLDIYDCGGLRSLPSFGKCSILESCILVHA